MRLTPWLVTTILIVPLSVAGQTHPAPTTAPKISIQAQHFLNLIASEDASEISLAQLALKKSSNPQVRQYAKTKILAADPSMKKGAMSIGQQNHAPVDGFPNATDKAEYYYLSRLSGQDFDKAYMSYEDAQQNSDLIVVQNEVEATKNQQVKAYAQKEETPVREAAQSAQQIAQALISG